MSPNNRAVLWKLRSQTIEFDRWPKVMGIVNVTPDSFSDGGKYFDKNRAVEHALKLASEGADILDVGGESTRPYSTPVGKNEELDRVLPVITEVVKNSQTPISIDTSKATVAKAAMEAGAEIINDVTGLEGDAAMLDVARQTRAGVCAMHMQGTPQTMQDHPTYSELHQEIYDYLDQRKKKLLDAGIEQERICLDPGIGFGKTHEHNIELLQKSELFLELGTPILIGHSRKGFIGKAIGDKTADRDPGTLVVSMLLAQKKMHVLRVHNVQATVHGLAMLKSASN